MALSGIASSAARWGWQRTTIRLRQYPPSRPSQKPRATTTRDIPAIARWSICHEHYSFSKTTSYRYPGQVGERQDGVQHRRPGVRRRLAGFHLPLQLIEGDI